MFVLIFISLLLCTWVRRRIGFMASLLRFVQVVVVLSKIHQSRLVLDAFVLSVLRATRLVLMIFHLLITSVVLIMSR
ncbi:hypothetical protein CSQ95_11805 [Janthinobacterium sp. BJB304]|nr:hypothetical protein CSQ95_11805 [Janthinobacterium sp. BJB304]